MTPKARSTFLAALGALALAVACAALAWACTPQAYMQLGGTDSGTQSDRPAAPIMPGDEVTVTGHQFQAGTSVKLHWGLTGPLIAEIATDAEGGWTHTFTTPADVAHGSYLLAAYAPGTVEVSEGAQPADPQAWPPVRLTLTLGPRAARETPDRPATKPAPERPATQNARDRHAERRRPQVPAVAKQPAAADVEPAAADVEPAKADAEPAEAAEPADANPALTRAERAEPAPAPPRTSRVSGPRVATPGSSPALTVAAVTDESRGVPWAPVALGALGLLLVGGAAGGLVVARRRPPRPVDGAGAEPDESRPRPDAVEAELQEIIAEHRLGERSPASR